MGARTESAGWPFAQSPNPSVPSYPAAPADAGDRYEGGPGTVPACPVDDEELVPALCCPFDDRLLPEGEPGPEDEPVTEAVGTADGEPEEGADGAGEVVVADAVVVAGAGTEPMAAEATAAPEPDPDESGAPAGVALDEEGVSDAGDVGVGVGVEVNEVAAVTVAAGRASAPGALVPTVVDGGEAVDPAVTAPRCPAPTIVPSCPAPGERGAHEAPLDVEAECPAVHESAMLPPPMEFRLIPAAVADTMTTIAAELNAVARRATRDPGLDHRLETVAASRPVTTPGACRRAAARSLPDANRRQGSASMLVPTALRRAGSAAARRRSTSSLASAVDN